MSAPGVPNDDSPDPAGPAAARWRELVTARLEEAERLRAGAGDLGPGFWDSRAEGFAAAVDGTATTDPFLAHVRRDVDPGTVVADVGAGSGRFALALAPQAAAVVAVDHSPAMLELIERGARERGLDNVTTRRGAWPDVDGVAADVVMCSYVIPMIPAADRFLAGLDAAAVAEELGLDPSVRVVEHRSMSRYDDLEAAVDSYHRRLLLPDDDTVREELARLLGDWLVEGDGGLGVPFTTFPMAILSWRP